MGLFGNKIPDDYHLASSIASTIDAFISAEGIDDFVNGNWSIALSKDYRVSLSKLSKTNIAIVSLNKLEEMKDFVATQHGSPLGYITTDRLAMAALKELKKQVESSKQKKSGGLFSFLNRKETYYENVCEILPNLGLTLSEKSFGKFKGMIETARKGSMNEHEAAITVASYMVVIGAELDLVNSTFIYQRVTENLEIWLKERLVRERVVGSTSDTIRDKLALATEKGKADKQGMPLTPDMPDIKKGKLLRMFGADGYTAILTKDAPAIAATIENVPGVVQLSYKFTFALLDNKSALPIYYVTLEGGITEGMFLCLFDRKGAHTNLGQNLDWENESGFTNKAIELIENEFSIKLKDRIIKT